MRSAVTSGSGGIVIGVPGFSLAQRGEKCFTQATRSARCCLVKVLHCGMFERSRPRAMVSKRSWSVGKVPVGVERHLNTPNWKSRGFGTWGFEPGEAFAIAIAQVAMATDAIAAVVGFGILGMAGDIADVAFRAHACFQVILS